MQINFQKYADGLIPAIVQDASTHKVLMLGFMNAEAYDITLTSGKVTFYSRSRQELWTKGTTSGNFLDVKELLVDCDSDTILIKAKPAGPVCHLGADTCFGETNEQKDFLYELEQIIKHRKANPKSDSYTSKLFAAGINRIAQKVGEEAVELIIEAKDGNDERLRSEAADVLYHLLVLFAERDIRLNDIIDELRSRSRYC